MAKAVTLYNANNEEIYPVTSSSLINGSIISSQIADSSITPSKLSFSLDYSTTEVDTGATWIDGSHIYKKTINFGNLPNATAKYVQHGISNIGYVIKIEGTAAAPNSTWITLPVVYRNADAAYNVEVSASLTDVVCNTSQDRSMFTAYVTLYYTKSA